jgi:hypothetical protein
VEYSPSTSTGSLRVHLEACHAYKYLEVCCEKGWTVKIKSLTLSKNSQQATIQPEPRPPFSTGRFKAALVNWVVADDQVRLNRCLHLQLINIIKYLVYQCR